MVAALLPVAARLFSVVITFAAVYAVASATEVSVYVTTMVTMIGIGVAVDYSMFVLARFREELEGGAAVETAVGDRDADVRHGRRLLRHHRVVLAGTIWIVPVRAVQSMARAAIMVVAVDVAATLTLLPALLRLVGRRVDRGRIGRAARRTSPASCGFWAAVDGAASCARPLLASAARRRC